ncbi:MAG: hypothetical protein ACRCSU_10170 [Paracoccaceae bacterium]
MRRLEQRGPAAPLLRIAALAAALLTVPVCLAAKPPGTLSIAVNLAEDGDFILAMLAAQQAGATSVPMTLYWDDVMKDGRWAPDDDFARVANGLYPTIRMKVQIVLPVIDTVNDRRPAELRGLAWDDPALLAAFDLYLAEALGRLNRLDIASISVGNEVDAFLTAPQDWAAYRRFYDHARATLARLRPEVPVGVNLTWPGLNGPMAAEARALAAAGDVWLVNHYSLQAGFHIGPPGDIAADMQAMVDMADGKPVYLSELGYPSDGCGSTEAMQRELLETAFATWSQHADRIPLVTLYWLHDISAEELAGFTDYYGVGDDCFARYLGTLGLRHRDGTDKPAFEWLREQAK